MEKLNLTGLSKSQKVDFLKKVAGSGNFKPFIEHSVERFILQETGLYLSETGKTMSLEEIRDIEGEYFFAFELVDRTDMVNKADPSQGFIPTEVQLSPYTLQTYLLYSQRNNPENEKS